MEVFRERVPRVGVFCADIVSQKGDGQSFYKLSLWPVNLLMLVRDRAPFEYLQLHPASLSSNMKTWL